MSEWWSPSLENRNYSPLFCWPIEERLQKLSMTHNFHFRKTLPRHDIGIEKQSKEMSNVPNGTICFDVFSQMHESGARNRLLAMRYVMCCVSSVDAERR
jgi:hypothetical protein